MDIAELKQNRNTLRMTTTQRLQALDVPSLFQYDYEKVLAASKEVDRIVSKFNQDAERINQNVDLSSEGRTRQLNVLAEKAKGDIRFQADLVQISYESAVQSYEGQTGLAPKTSDVLLADASTRLHFILRNQKRVHEHTFIDIYRDAVTDGDTAMSEWVRHNYRSLVRQYTGKAAQHPERIVEASMSDSEVKRHRNALKGLDVAANLRQAAMYQLQ